ncbi:DUF1992 domain-containing protein [Ectothiorhodospiraceae bacterium WFHF3C12]|nr:DUF1992 domain-containing protein [Ectothiorhodospiraceae bacterium WFHF3C12]
MSMLDELAESRIREAMERGELERLPGSGQPMRLDDDSMVPEELRMAYRVLRNANYLPPELQLRRDIERIEDLLTELRDSEAEHPRRQEAHRRLTVLRMQLDSHRGRRGAAPLWADPLYERRLLAHLERNDAPENSDDGDWRREHGPPDGGRGPFTGSR